MQSNASRLNVQKINLHRIDKDKTHIRTHAYIYIHTYIHRHTHRHTHTHRGHPHLLDEMSGFSIIDIIKHFTDRRLQPLFGKVKLSKDLIASTLQGKRD